MWKPSGFPDVTTATSSRFVSWNGHNRHQSLPRRGLKTRIRVSEVRSKNRKAPTWILRVLPCRPHFDTPWCARSRNNLSIERGIAAKILLPVSAKDIEPDDGIRSDTAVSPVPTVDVLGEWLVRPILVMVAHTVELQLPSGYREVYSCICVWDSVCPPDMRAYVELGVGLQRATGVVRSRYLQRIAELAF